MEVVQAEVLGAGSGSRSFDTRLTVRAQYEGRLEFSYSRSATAARYRFIASTCSFTVRPSMRLWW